MDLDSVPDRRDPRLAGLGGHEPEVLLHGREAFLRRSARQTSNLGTIEAVFFRERLPYRSGRWGGRKEEQEKISANERGEGRLDAPEAGAPTDAARPEPQAAGARDLSQKSSSHSSSSSPSDDLAATGIGQRTRFDIVRVDLDLEDSPAMSVRIRYEFRPQLIALGVIRESGDPIARRESGRGFSDYCPEPN